MTPEQRVYCRAALTGIVLGVAVAAGLLLAGAVGVR